MPYEGAVARAGSVSNSREAFGNSILATLLARSEIHHGEAIEIGQLHEGPSGCAIWPGLDRHRANPLVELELPRHPFARKVDTPVATEPVTAYLPSAVI